MRLVLPFAATVLMALGGSPAWAAPATSSTATFELPLSSTVINPCNGETVAWQGTAHFAIHRTVTSTGRETLSGEVNFQGVSGQGSLGNAYRMVDTATFEMTPSGDRTPSEFTTTAAFLFVSQGPAPNFVARTTYHVTIDANGELTASVIEITSECRG